jgi:hypothetical protein
VTHRRQCQCCKGCEYLADHFDRDELGDDWSQISGTWSIGEGGVSTSDGNASLKCNRQHPDGYTTYVFSADVLLTSYDAEAKLIVDYDGSQKTAVYKVASDRGGRVDVYDGGAHVNGAYLDGISLNSPFHADVCLDKESIHANGIGGPISGATTSTVALGTGTLSGHATFYNVHLSKHSDDNPGCAKCFRIAPPCANCNSGYPENENHTPEFVYVQLENYWCNPWGEDNDKINQTFALKQSGWWGGYLDIGCPYLYVFPQPVGWIWGVGAVIGQYGAAVGFLSTGGSHWIHEWCPHFRLQLSSPVDCLSFSSDMPVCINCSENIYCLAVQCFNYRRINGQTARCRLWT